MADNTIEKLMKLVHRSPGYNEFLEHIRNDTGIGRAEKAVSYEFGSLQEFYHWVKVNVSINDSDDQVSIRGAMPGKKNRAPIPFQHHARLNELKAECEELRDHLARVLVELQELAKTVIPGLTALYATRIGPIELELFALRCQNLRKKRTIELVQISLDRNEPLNTGMIEKTLNQEYQGWHLQLEEQDKTFRKARESFSALMNDKEAREFKQLFRVLVRRLHPDINPGQGEKARMLWFSLQSAYEKGEMDMLRSEASRQEHTAPSAFLPESSGIESWEKAKKELATKISTLEKEIGQITASHPYTLKEQLHDEQWIVDRIAQIRSLVDAEQDLARILDAKEKSLIDTWGRE